MDNPNNRAPAFMLALVSIVAIVALVALVDVSHGHFDVAGGLLVVLVIGMMWGPAGLRAVGRIFKRDETDTD